jgi:hypothetical protein
MLQESWSYSTVPYSTVRPLNIRAPRTGCDPHKVPMGTAASKDEKLPPITYDKDGKQLGRCSMRRLRLPATGAARRAGGARLRMHVRSLGFRKEGMVLFRP